MKRRFSCLLLALAMVLSMACLPGRTVMTAYGETLNEQLTETRERIKELDEQLAEARANKQSAMEQKYILDQRNSALMEEIEVLEVQISETTARIEENEILEAQQYELFCRQVREEEERGTTSYWSVLFKATSFTDLLSRLDFVNEVMDYDRNVIEELRATRAQLAADRAALEQQKQELDAAKAELEQHIAEAAALVAQYSDEEDELKALQAQKEADAARLEQEIREEEERRRREEEERRRREEEERRRREEEEQQQQQPVVTESGYAWPTNDTRLITSPFGNRPAPGGIYSTNHGGVDIGANYGTNVLASKSGTVIISRWYGGYGYCVAIQHGYGNITLYGHMSRLLCSEGQQVSQGQVIGLVGSTGNSTGPHIHFEIHENGVRVNPLNYLTGWVRGFS